YDPVVMVVRDGSLTITPRAHVVGVHHNGFNSARSWDFTDGAASVELVQAPNPASNADATFALASDSGNWMRFTLEHGALAMQANESGSTNSQTVAYDSVAHRFLRLRHERASGESLWEASPDGIAYTTLRRRTVNVPLTAMRAELEAGTYQLE